jgi:hypothetical protein
MEKIHAKQQRTLKAVGNNITAPELMQFLHYHDLSIRK